MTKDRINIIINKLRNNKYVNKYTVTIFVFGFWISFFDTNSFINQYEVKKERKEIEKKVKQYKNEIEKNKTILEALNSDTETLERFAREHYKMKKKNEDIYIIKE